MRASDDTKLRCILLLHSAIDTSMVIALDSEIGYQVDEYLRKLICLWILAMSSVSFVLSHSPLSRLTIIWPKMGRG